MLSKRVNFKKAMPCWAEGYIREMNISLELKAEVRGRALLRIAASSCYQIFCGGGLFEMGPARCGHGYFRVDELPLPEGCGEVKIIVAGYNNNGFEYCDQPPFICCELEEDGEVTVATAGDSFGFETRLYNERVSRCQRFSFQRNFAEVYDFAAAEERPVLKAVPAINGKIEFIERGVPVYDHPAEFARKIIDEGTLGFGGESKFRDRSIFGISPALKGFTVDELQCCSTFEAERFTYKSYGAEERIPAKDERLLFGADTYKTFEMEKNFCGVIAFEVENDGPCCIYAMFDEIAGPQKNVDFLRMGTSSVVKWQLTPGSRSLITFEPYVFKYLRIAVTGGSAVLANVHIRRVGFYRPPVTAATDNPKVAAVIEAAIETFRQNTMDIFMDCASRERAGWLCDSYFTSQVEYLLTGRTQVERNFLENFLLPDKFDFIPGGMLPMCYPSDHNDGVFIPNWAMWYVIELEQYFGRSGDRELVDRARERVYGLLEYFKAFENVDGLLQNLESWIFVEWSRSNELVQDVNFPTNMVYGRMLKSVAALYGDAGLAEKAERLFETIRAKSFNGTFFCDNLVFANGDRNGALVPSGECTESCQYYAFHTGVATPETYPELWKILLTDFGPHRKQVNPYPLVAFSNAFIGNYLRLDVLSRYDRSEEIMDNIEGYFYYMAEKTGTLWEIDSDNASCSHGFASYVLCWLDKLGCLKKG